MLRVLADVVNTCIYLLKDKPVLMMFGKKVWTSKKGLLKFGTTYCLLSAKEALKEKKLSQSTLAGKGDITRQTLPKLEKGDIAKTSLQVFIKILEALDQELYIEDKKPFYYFDPKSVE